jgi:hypothetical protein
MGGTKPGVGIVYNLGAKTPISSVAVALKGDGTSIQLMVPKGDTTKSPSSVDGWTAVDSKADQPEGTVALKPQTPTETQYVLVYLTKLPKADGGFRGIISEVTIQK